VSKFSVVRKNFYVDGKIQGVLLVGLVALEVSLVAAAIWFLHKEFAAIVDARLYRIHPDPNEPTMAAIMVWSLAKVLAALLLVNIVALVVADRVWGWYVEGVIKTFQQCVDKLGQLDFRKGGIDRQRHHSLDLIARWRDLQRERFASLRREHGQTIGKARKILASRKELS